MESIDCIGMLNLLNNHLPVNIPKHIASREVLIPRWGLYSLVGVESMDVPKRQIKEIYSSTEYYHQLPVIRRGLNGGC